jgi:hypothetical protein
LVQDVTYYSKAALYDAFKTWRDGGPSCSGRFDEKGLWKATLTTRTTRYDQAGKKIANIEKTFDTRVYENSVWGLKWFADDTGPMGYFPQYFRRESDQLVAVPTSEVPPETNLLDQEFKLARPGEPYTSPNSGAWHQPGPATDPSQARLVDGSVVTYCWYRFVDQPSFQQYNWGTAKKAKLQTFVENIHAHWPIDRDYMAPPTTGELARLDPALFVTPPEGMEVGYVPIVVRQQATSR